MPPLLSEDDIHAVPPAPETTPLVPVAPAVAAASAASAASVATNTPAPAPEVVSRPPAPPTRLDALLTETIEQVKHDKADLRNEICNLRIDIERSMLAAKRQAMLLGLFVTLLFTGSASYMSAIGLPAATAPMPVTEQKNEVAAMTAMAAELEQLRATNTNLKAALESPAGKPEQTSAATKRLDCANLPADAKTHSVDYLIQFELGSAKISPTSEGTLDSIGKMLSLAPDNCVLVEGYADASGQSDKNLTLSIERANAVVQYITGKTGIDRQRLLAVGKGASTPVSGLDPRDPKNRSVVFKVVAG